MDFEKQINYWVQSAEHDWETAEELIKNEKYDWALFIGHLVLEKILKAIYISIKKEFPEKTHNLIRLANLSKLELSAEDRVFFEQVNSFHISTRYPDEQFKFYKICTREFSMENFKKIKDSYQWLKEKLKL
jgi:HEPN domain-containing protein